MASPFSSKSKSLSTTKRSISLPPRSHPTTQKIEEELNTLKTWETTTSAESHDAEVLCSGLVGLSELQRRVDDLLNLPQTLHALSGLDEKWADELLEKSVKILDICGMTREIALQFKESVWDLQSCLRRKKGNNNNNVSEINKYNSLRKNIKQVARKLIGSLKKMDQEIWASVSLDVDHHVSAVIRALRESSSMSNFILQKVLILLSVLISDPKPSKWALVSRLVLNKGVIIIGSHQEQEQSKNKIDELERLGGQFESIENELENCFRSLIRSRSSLLNVISCH